MEYWRSVRRLEGRRRRRRHEDGRTSGDCGYNGMWTTVCVMRAAAIGCTTGMTVSCLSAGSSCSLWTSSS